MGTTEHRQKGTLCKNKLKMDPIFKWETETTKLLECNVGENEDDRGMIMPFQIQHHTRDP